MLIRQTTVSQLRTEIYYHVLLDYLGSIYAALLIDQGNCGCAVSGVETFNVFGRSTDYSAGCWIVYIERIHMFSLVSI